MLQRNAGEANGLLLHVREDREGRPWAVCDVDGRRVLAGANGIAPDAVGRPVVIKYSRVDANGDLRTLPCHLAEQGGMDGFYAARLRRVS